MLFWVVLIVVGVLIWNFSTKLQQHEHQVTFNDFMTQVERGEIASVTITGQDIAGHTKAGEKFTTYAPAQYDGLANKLLDRGVAISAKEPTASPWASLLYSWAPVLLMIGF